MLWLYRTRADVRLASADLGGRRTAVEAATERLNEIPLQSALEKEG